MIETLTRLAASSAAWLPPARLAARIDPPSRPMAPRIVAEPISRRFPGVRRRFSAPGNAATAQGKSLAAPKRPRSARSLRERHDVLVRELRLAERVQRSMLPRTLPDLPNVAFGASLRPSLHLAGDFYNITRLDRDHLAICLGDVMGHGPAAALLGVFAMQGLRMKKIEGSSYEIIQPSEVLDGLSRDLMEADFAESPFVTMFYGVIDLTGPSLTYCCGGHPPALLLRGDGPPRPLGEGGPLLGVYEAEFRQETVPLLPGDRLLVFSDGIESTRWGDAGHGLAGLVDLVGPKDARSPQQRVSAAMAMAAPGDGPADDVTVVLAEFS